MKDKGSKSMRTIGSLTLCRSLLNAGLADRFRVVVFPVITGSSGRERIYDGYPDVALDMISSRTFDGRIQLLPAVRSAAAVPGWVHKSVAARNGAPSSGLTAVEGTVLDGSRAHPGNPPATLTPDVGPGAEAPDPSPREDFRPCPARLSGSIVEPWKILLCQRVSGWFRPRRRSDRGGGRPGLAGRPSQ